MKKVFLVAGLGIMLAFSSCEKDDDNNNDVNSTDQTFTTNVSMGNTAEIMAGQLAASKGNSTAVRNFGQLMVTEHTQAQADLQTVAATINLQLPTTVDAEHQALMTRLNSLSGRSFDTAYM